MRRFAAVGALVALTVAAGVLVFGAVTAPSAGAATCTGTSSVQIVSMTFNPPTIYPGQSSTATLVAQNCTSQAISANIQWYARWQGSDLGIPAGCAVVDPIQFPLSLPASGQATSVLGYSTFSGCTATGLVATATISSGATTLATQNATLVIGNRTSSSSPSPSTSAKPTCAVTYAKQSEWGGGFVAQVTIANSAPYSISGWTLAFTFPGDQKITNAWNATVTQTGAAVTAGNLSYNVTIPAGGSVSFGFQGTWHTSDASPTAFTLNRAACSVS